jgi:hypothetical protein
MANIIVLREQFGVFRRSASRADGLRHAELAAPHRRPDRFFVGENQAATESQAAWDNINLTAKKLAC